MLAAHELDLGRFVQVLSPLESRDVAQRLKATFGLHEQQPKHAVLSSGGDSDRRRLPADPYERLLSSFLANGTRAYCVSHSAVYEGPTDLEVLLLREARHASVLSWWAGVENFYWCGTDLGFALSVNPYSVQARGDTGIPDALWTSFRRSI